MRRQLDQWIVAQRYSGHRLMYVKLLVEEAIRRGYQPTIVLPVGALASAEFAAHLGAHLANIRTVELPRVTRDTVIPLLSDRPDLPTIFPEGDEWLLGMILSFRRWPGGARLLIMRPEGQARSAVRGRAQTAAKRILRLLANARAGNRVLTLASFWSRQSRSSVPDPIRVAGSAEMARSVREAWNVAQVRAPMSWVGVVGALNGRKNINLVAESLVHLDQGSVGLVVAGRCLEGEEVMARWLEPARAAGIPVVRNSGLLSDDELDSTLRALDCVVLAHSNEGPSGILGKAKVLGTRVLLAGARSLRDDAMKLADGTVWVDLSVSELARGLRVTLETAAPPSRDGGSRVFVSAFFD